MTTSFVNGISPFGPTATVSRRPSNEATRKKIVDYITANQPCLEIDIRRHLGVESELHCILRTLAKRGRITLTPPARRGPSGVNVFTIGHGPLAVTPATLQARSKIALACLPDAPYRSMLAALHADMLASIKP